MLKRLILCLCLCLWATFALAQGYLNPPIYGTGMINVQPGTTVTTNIVNSRNPPANLNVLAQGAITTWNIHLPDPAFDGQLIGIGCPGGSAPTINVTATNGSILPGGLTSCTTGEGVAIYYQFAQTYNNWTPIFNTTGTGGGGPTEYYSTVYSINDVPGIDCTGTTDSSAALNTIFSSISGKHIRLINTSNNPCHIVVTQQLQVLNATEWWIDGDSNAAGNANAGFTISGCGTPTSPLGGYNALFYINASYHWRMTNLSLEVNGGSKCSSASTFTTGIQRDNAGGSYTSTDSVIDNVSVTANFSGSSAVSGFKGIIDTATSANGENFRILNSYVFCQANTNSVGIQFLGRFADLSELHHNYIGGSNNAGCYRAIEDNASQLRVENNFGGNETGGYSIFGAGGAFFYLDACPTGFQSLSIIGNETDTSGPFFSNNGDTANAGCGNGVVRIDGNEVGSSDMAANTPAINVGNANNDPTRPGVFYVTNNVLNNNAANSFPMIGSYSTNPNIGTLIAWGNFRVDGNPIYMNTGSFSGGSGSAIAPPQAGFLESWFSSQGTSNDFRFVPDNLSSFGGFTARSAASIYETQTAVNGALNDYFVYSYLANAGGSPSSTLVIDAENGTGQATGSIAALPNFTGQLNLVATASAPNIGGNTVANVGTAGSTTDTYEVVGVGGGGCLTAASAAMTTTTANATLTTGNYNSITVNTNDYGIVGYKLYRTAAGGTPSTTGLIGWLPVVNSATSHHPVNSVGNVVGGNGQQLVFHDTGIAGDSTTPNATSTCTGSLAVAGSITINGMPVSGGGLTPWPIIPSNVAGIITTTTGTIAATSHSLAVSSVAGWKAGEGIEIPGAGAAGVLLLTSVTAVGTSTLTVAAAATTTATSVTIQHDDTAALQAAITTGLNVLIPPGNYNVYAASGSALTIAAQQWVQCSGADAYNTNTSGTIIWNRGTIDNTVNITSGQVHFIDCGIEQAADVTPTAGYGLTIGSGSPGTLLADGGWIERNFVLNTYGLLHINSGVIAEDISYNHFYANSTNVKVMATYDNTSPAGDNQMVANDFEDNSAQNLTCLTITNGDTNNWIGNSFEGCGTMVSATAGTATGQYFVGGIMEGSGTGTTCQIIISSSAQRFGFTGIAFSLDNGHGAFCVSSTADYVVATGNTLTPSIAGTPWTNSSSGVHNSYVGNVDSNMVSYFGSASIAIAQTGAFNYEALTPVAISGLATCNSGFSGNFAVVSNGITSPTYHQAVSSTGSTAQPVFCNGSAWVYD